MTMSALIIDVTLWGSVLVLGFIAFRRAASSWSRRLARARWISSTSCRASRSA
jgi:hypothetical protein